MYCCVGMVTWGENIILSQINKIKLLGKVILCININCLTFNTSNVQSGLACFRNCAPHHGFIWKLCFRFEFHFVCLLKRFGCCLVRKVCGNACKAQNEDQLRRKINQKVREINFETCQRLMKQARTELYRITENKLLRLKLRSSPKACYMEVFTVLVLDVYRLICKELSILC